MIQTRCKETGESSCITKAMLTFNPKFGRSSDHQPSIQLKRVNEECKGLNILMINFVRYLPKTNATHDIV